MITSLKPWLMYSVNVDFRWLLTFRRNLLPSFSR